MSPSPDAPARRSGGDLADYVSLLRRRRLAVLSMLLAGTGGGVTLLWLTPPSYTASAQVLVTPVGPQEQVNQVTARQREPLNLDTEAQVARSAVVAAKARGLFAGLPGPAEVSVPPNTSVLEISCTAAAPATAASCANAYSLAYLAQRRETSTRALSAQLRAVLAKLKQVNASLTAVATALPGLDNGTSERALALQRQNVLLRQVHTLTARYDALRTIAVTPGSVIGPPVAPTEPRAPRPPLYLGSGLMAGLLCGVGLAWVRDRLDTTLRTAADVRRLTGLDAVGDEELRGLAGAVLVVSVPGTSPREVRRAVRALRERGVPVAGTLLTGDTLSPSAVRPPPAPRPGGKRAREAGRQEIGGHEVPGYAPSRHEDVRHEGVPRADGRGTGGRAQDGRDLEVRDLDVRHLDVRGLDVRGLDVRAGSRDPGGRDVAPRDPDGRGPGDRDPIGRDREAPSRRTGRPLAGLAGGHRATPPPPVSPASPPSPSSVSPAAPPLSSSPPPPHPPRPAPPNPETSKGLPGPEPHGNVPQERQVAAGRRGRRR
ncbi:YveK family protein [Streptosporangium longisporum]|uniref:Polysaccharide chain length determinant N-terminal domain-containing protein n=1 Tax=Streptosporangium longisporum TaxID=46187 RepID=A0ABP6KRT0_9ACTN